MQNEKLEIQNDGDSVTPNLPKLVSLREFVEQMEREHGDSLHLHAIRAAMEE